MGPRVLIVEHELVTAEPLMLILSWSGFTVHRVHEAGQALAHMRLDPPDLVLVNEKLPGGRGGLQLCREIRRDVELRSVPVVVFGAADESDVAWRQAGATAFLRKPIGIRLLPTLVRELMRARSGGASAEIGLSTG